MQNKNFVHLLTREKSDDPTTAAVLFGAAPF